VGENPAVTSEPVDPEAIGPRSPGVLGAIAAGGVLGAEARAGIAAVLPTAPGGFPWATLAVNATGCLLIGVLLVLGVGVGGGHPLARPFLGVGVLGGYTTFSGYAVDAQRLLAGGHTGTALAALAATPLLALLAVTVAARLTRWAVPR